MNSVLASTESSTNLLDNLKQRFMFVQKKTTKAKTRLTKPEKYIKNTLLNGFNDDTDDRNYMDNVFNSDQLFKKKELPMSNVLDVKNLINFHNDSEMKYERSTVANSMLTKEIIMATSDASLSNDQDYDVIRNNIFKSDSMTVKLKKLKHTKRPNIDNIKFNMPSVKYTDTIKSLGETDKMQFLQMIDHMLDRPSGVDEVFKEITLPAYLNKSILFEVENPFRNLVDEEALMVSFLKRLKYINRPEF